MPLIRCCLPRLTLFQIFKGFEVSPPKKQFIMCHFNEILQIGFTFETVSCEFEISVETEVQMLLPNQRAHSAATHLDQSQTLVAPRKNQLRCSLFFYRKIITSSIIWRVITFCEPPPSLQLIGLLFRYSIEHNLAINCSKFCSLYTECWPFCANSANKGTPPFHLRCKTPKSFDFLDCDLVYVEFLFRVFKMIDDRLCVIYHCK